MKYLLWLGAILIVVGTVGAQQAQAPLTFPDVDTPAAAQGVALDAWKNKVESTLNDHELRLRKLEAILAAQPAPPTSTTLSSPTVTGGGTISSNLIVGTQNGTVATWNYAGKPGTYQISMSGAGPTGVLQLLINGQSYQPTVLINLPPDTPAVQAVTVNLPGPCAIGFKWVGGWANISTTITVQ